MSIDGNKRKELDFGDNKAVNEAVKSKAQFRLHYATDAERW
jgi:hypothetical protein